MSVTTSSLIANIATGLSAIGCLFMLVSTFAVLRWKAATRPAACNRPVSILKPLNGREPKLFSRLASYCRQHYDGPVQLVFGTLESHDPALEIVERLRLAFPEIDIVTVAGGKVHGANRKVSNLINMHAHARHETLLFSDSDIQVPTNHVQSVVSALDEPGTGAVTCLYHGLAGGGVWSHLSAMSINTHFLPSVLLAQHYDIAKPCFGAAICLDAATLKTVGGLHALSNVLADDYVLGEVVRQQGCSVRIAAASVGHVCFEASGRQLVERELRVARTIKSIDQLGYLGSVVTYPFAWSLLALAFGQSYGLCLAALASRLAVVLSVEHKFRVPRQRYWLLPFHDLLSFVIFLASLRGSAVVWRGARMRVRMRDGTLTRDETSP